MNLETTRNTPNHRFHGFRNFGHERLEMHRCTGCNRKFFTNANDQQFCESCRLDCEVIEYCTALPKYIEIESIA